MQHLERIIQSTATTSVPQHFLTSGIERAKAVGRVVIAGKGGISGMGTGFLISTSHILTCHHVIPTVDIASQSRIEFDFFERDDGSVNQPSVYRFAPDSFFATNVALDITVVKLADPGGLRSRPSIQLPRRAGNIIVGENVNLIHHSGGEPRMFSLRGARLLNILDDFLHYSGDSGPGSAGAPLFNDQWVLIGVHHAGVPSRDDEGRILAADGSMWDGNSDLQIQWLAKEAVRASRVARWLDSEGLSDLDDVVTANVVSPKRPDQDDSSRGFVPESPIRDSVFISYAHADQENENWKDRLVLQIRPIQSIGETRVWEDSRIQPGADWLQEIEYALQNTRVAILLVGPHFLNSEFIMTEELPPLIEAAEQGGVKILPLITDYCPYSLSVLGKYQSFNDPNQPLESLTRSEQNQILHSLATEVANVFDT